MATVSFRNIEKAYGPVKVIHGIGFDIADGEFVVLVGPSGCGKSTLLDLLALVLAPDAAETFDLELSGTVSDIAALWRQGRQNQLAQLRSQYLGYVLQAGGLLGFLDVRRNIGLSRALLGLAEDATVQRLAERLEIADQLDKLPAALSVGQRQRVSIARALAHAPAIVLADEPTASLDPVNAERVMQLLVAQAEEQGACIVVATHDEALVRRVGLQLQRLQVQRNLDGGVTATLLEVG